MRLVPVSALELSSSCPAGGVGTPSRQEELLSSAPTQGNTHTVPCTIMNNVHLVASFTQQLPAEGNPVLVRSFILLIFLPPLSNLHVVAVHLTIETS